MEELVHPTLCFHLWEQVSVGSREGKRQHIVMKSLGLESDKRALSPHAMAC